MREFTLPERAQCSYIPGTLPLRINKAKFYDLCALSPGTGTLNIGYPLSQLTGAQRDKHATVTNGDQGPATNSVPTARNGRGLCTSAPAHHRHTRRSRGAQRASREAVSAPLFVVLAANRGPAALGGGKDGPLTLSAGAAKRPFDLLLACRWSAAARFIPRFSLQDRTRRDRTNARRMRRPDALEPDQPAGSRTNFPRR